MDAGISLEAWFEKFRNQIIGQKQMFTSPEGPRRILYADWAASGRAYLPIEKFMLEEVLPFYGNTHTCATVTGATTTKAYEASRLAIKAHVGAGEDDTMIFCGSGMTAAVNKLQRIMGMRIPDRAEEYMGRIQVEESKRPVVFITHMEHHSNQISWLETIATVEIIRPDANGNVDLDHLQRLLKSYRQRKVKIAAVTSCSNVTGIETPYHRIAGMMHEHGGLCLVDFTCSAPYVKMDMHPHDGRAGLDAIYFSCHKFLGGPGTPGILIFNKQLYKNKIPDQPGGGTVMYTNPWHSREYLENIEDREDGGTPAIVQGIKAGLCIRLKEEMGIEKMLEREAFLVKRLLEGLSFIPGINILESRNTKRLGVVSFTVSDIHYDSFVQSLNNNFGIQARGGCSCAGTYGHLLLGIGKTKSATVLKSLRAGDLRSKPGWVRLSIHPTMTSQEIDFIVGAVGATISSSKTNIHSLSKNTSPISCSSLAHSQHDRQLLQ
jgi:selenocysteine lyase/cysteine desulfurase